ncbi:MAG: M1 family metallopeptidase [Deltaproteobacteria bacterium]|nr:M1 family metallopeptidase [Deltaproteobacteria bacterium]
MARRDPHSYNDDTQVATESVAWTARIDFAAKVLHCEAVLTFREPGGGALDLDTRDLAIESVSDHDGKPLPFTLHPTEPHLGARLAIELPARTKSIKLRYKTSPDASALQWLDPAQTMGGKLPYLFSQCQACHARSIIPLQDTPRLRIRYTAELSFPQTLTAVMAAADRGRTVDGAIAVSRWEMPQPIPPYLLAFAVGDLKSKDISARCRAWAEPAQVDAAAYEYAGVEAMIHAAENLFGPYDWERFDILTMPPSFPYGGMENPRITFITPTVITGDRSLVSVIAHELAHSWTGNLVTNANAEHFWLNEGFTMYAERRIIEALDGSEMASLSAALGRRELDESVARFKDRPEMTRLRVPMQGIDPDDAYSLVPYEKGYFFLCAIEAAVGRPAFEAWLKTYLRDFRFGAITTEDFEAHIERGLPGALAKVDARTWIDGEGVPAAAVAPRSARLDAIEELRGGPAPVELASTWDATEWNLYLETIARPASAELLQTLDARFRLTQSTNHDVLVAWLTLCLQSGYHAVQTRVDEVLASVGRMKYLRPLYTALAKEPTTRARAQTTYERLRAGYHPIARQMVESVLREHG